VRLRLTLDRPDRQQLLTLGGYALASALYIAIGLKWLDFLLSFWVGAAYLLATVWLIPTLVRRFVRRPA
jgi:hypothetical protein